MEKQSMRVLCLLEKLLKRKFSIACSVFVVCNPLLIQAGVQEHKCGKIKATNWQIYDYRNPKYHENGVPQGTNHFAPQVENLIKGVTGPLIGDLDYTLRQFPNHHRALWTVSRYQRMLGGKLPQPNLQGVSWIRSAECYFDRAIRFAPDDAVVYMLFGMHLHLSGKTEDGLKAYKKAEKLGLDSAEFYYNRGLLYFDMKNYEAALKDAQQAQMLGYPLTGLQKKLRQVEKKWNDAP